MLLFDKYFYKNKESKLVFRDRVIILNDFLYEYRRRVWVSMLI